MNVNRDNCVIFKRTVEKEQKIKNKTILSHCGLFTYFIF